MSERRSRVISVPTKGHESSFWNDEEKKECGGKLSNLLSKLRWKHYIGLKSEKSGGRVKGETDEVRWW